MAEKPAGHILIECPNTIFHLYARDEGEFQKLRPFCAISAESSGLG